MPDIKVEYRCPVKPAFRSVAYVDEETGRGEDKYTDIPVNLHWTGDEWVDDCG